MRKPPWCIRLLARWLLMQRQRRVRLLFNWQPEKPLLERAAYRPTSLGFVHFRVIAGTTINEWLFWESSRSGVKLDSLQSSARWLSLVCRAVVRPVPRNNDLWCYFSPPDPRMTIPRLPVDGFLTHQQLTMAPISCTSHDDGLNLSLDTEFDTS